MKSMRGAPSAVCWRELHAVCSGRALQLTHFSCLPVNEKGQPDSAMTLRHYNLCLWIMDIPSKWRPIYVLYHAPLHLFWLGLWLDSWRFYWWWTSWFIRSSQPGPSIKAPCQDRHVECTVTCCLWQTALSRVSFLQNGAFLHSFHSPLWLLPDTRQ